MKWGPFLTKTKKDSTIRKGNIIEIFIFIFLLFFFLGEKNIIES